MRRLNASEPVYGATCKHGPGECAGNVQQLCVAAHTPRELWWPFVQCQNSHGKATVGTPALTRACARQIGFDWDAAAGVSACARMDDEVPGEEGKALLLESASVVQALGIVCVRWLQRERKLTRSLSGSGTAARL
jgi:hypothetical protein